MTCRHIAAITGAVLFAFGSLAPASAEVATMEQDLFVVRHSGVAPVDAEETWQVLINPADWWNGEHSFSGDAENFTLDARAGGCFCEMLPAGDDRKQPGSVRHLEVVFVDPGTAIRLTGALGPLQSEPVTGVLTITLKAEGVATRLLFEYAVAGPSRYKPETIAPAVDAVIGEQLERLIIKLGGRTEGSAFDKGDGTALRSDSSSDPGGINAEFLSR